MKLRFSLEHIKWRQTFFIEIASQDLNQFLILYLKNQFTRFKKKNDFYIDIVSVLSHQVYGAGVHITVYINTIKHTSRWVSVAT